MYHVPKKALREREARRAVTSRSQKGRRIDDPENYHTKASEFLGKVGLDIPMLKRM